MRTKPRPKTTDPRGASSHVAEPQIVTRDTFEREQAIRELIPVLRILTADQLYDAARVILQRHPNPPRSLLLEWGVTAADRAPWQRGEHLD